MNIPNLPTDNLYKFIALVGLIIVLICSIVPFLNMIEVSNKVNLIETEVGKIDLEYDIFWVKIKSLNYESDRLLESYLEKIDTASLSKRVDLTDKWRDESKKIKDETIKLLEQMMFKRYSIDRQIELMGNKTSKIAVNSILWGLGIFFGVVLMGIGFYFWFYRVQIYLDKKLKFEVESMEKK